MKNIWIITKKECASYFYSPIAYVVFAMFTLVSGYFFYNILSVYTMVSMRAMQNQYGAEGLNFTEGIFIPLFSNMSIIMLLMMPLLTMRLLSEEKRSGTFELLLTYPLRDIETVLGKFFACFLVFATMLGLTLAYPIFLSFLGKIEYGALIACYVGLLLMGSAFISFGLLASAWTSNQIIAAVISFGALLLFWMVGFSAYNASPEFGAILSHLSLLDHFDNFTKGIIESKDVIYYLNFTIFCLFLTLRSLESNKWRG
ncbi:ABC-type transport system involved in multi-copper enzyme maturation, permease component [Candidatus Moduliflexus flocculans]|uniref:ABC-type transport system involved in multi-copper enzyme maturation, permease component n=1 Tax=Candidatus Moduliflexus flocculans TaxID=1499966 RepID=A0A0S6VZ07_9BACT|nr:ABC-type transport system involved in multi-copper enzyme maturation, permease component [Candidatus Moduliflexus flocculans]